MRGPLLLLFSIPVLIAGFVSAMRGRRKLKDVPDFQYHTSEPEEDIALYYNDRQAYYRKLGVYTEEEIQEKLEEEREILRDYEELYGKD